MATALWMFVWEGWLRMLVGSPAFDADLLGAYRSRSVVLPVAGRAAVLVLRHAALPADRLRNGAPGREARELGHEVLAREAELRALRAQIDPHFLFNSLQSLSALTSTDSAGARRMCLLLADFFRSSVRLGAQDRILLEQEMDMVRAYLDIEKVRFGSRLAAEVVLEPGCGNCVIPPLVLQPTGRETPCATASTPWSTAASWK